MSQAVLYMYLPKLEIARRYAVRSAMDAADMYEQYYGTEEDENGDEQKREEEEKAKKEEEGKKEVGEKNVQARKLEENKNGRRPENDEEGEDDDDDPGEKEAQLRAREVVEALARELGVTPHILLKIFNDARGDPTNRFLRALPF